MTQDPSPAGIRNRFLRIWSPRIGAAPAAAYFGAIRDGTIAASLGPIWFVLILAGFVAGIAALWVAGIVVIGAQTTLFVLGWLELRRFKREASESLGVKVGWREIPAKQDEYVRWCERQGIEPFGRG
jgi:hypothetical protein